MAKIGKRTKAALEGLNREKSYDLSGQLGGILRGNISHWNSKLLGLAVTKIGLWANPLF